MKYLYPCLLNDQKEILVTSVSALNDLLFITIPNTSLQETMNLFSTQAYVNKIEAFGEQYIGYTQLGSIGFDSWNDKSDVRIVLMRR